MTINIEIDTSHMVPVEDLDERDLIEKVNFVSTEWHILSTLVSGEISEMD